MIKTVLEKMDGKRNLADVSTKLLTVEQLRRFCPSAFFGYLLALSRRLRQVVGRHEVAQGATSQRRRAHQRSTLPNN